MPSVHLSARGVPDPIRAGLDALHERLEVPDGVPADVVAEALETIGAVHRRAVGFDHIVAQRLA